MYEDLDRNLNSVKIADYFEFSQKVNADVETQ